MTDRRTHLQETIETTLTDRDAGAFVHVGPAANPSVRYCLESDASETDSSSALSGVGRHAVAVTADDGLEHVSADENGVGTAHPTQELATRLSDRGISGPVLTPRTIPHDAACYLEQAGFELASSDALERARAVKTPAERQAIERVQAAASEGVRAVASSLADASVVDDHGHDRLAVDGTVLTPQRLRRTADEAVVAAGAYPAGTTVVDAGGRAADEEVRPGEAITVALAPRGPDGYRGGLARTVVVDGDGGRERRAHVAVTGALKSARAMLAGGETSVPAIRGDLEAEVMAFGFDDGIETTVHGVGLEPHERPGRDETVQTGAVVRLEAAVTDLEGGAVRIADLVVVDGAETRPLAAPSRSLAPDALVESAADVASKY
ncbi:M24 family metallopeptidase [Natrialbaceae archaeon AArc-T1-2]|uniref:M24 family metallopeptidase n=1 Tax=Natrialbaceae archaeon AArc-T1-2 TaxID=3053904 RepID=UPI00255B1BEC|nr:M24 family metallopeptidase [Natrialbaceae archaeon AArc-T1-2]WIV67036.1 M24 family metallopeptidase [Natrialbaceae archaeon AArc-T1-2]